MAWIAVEAAANDMEHIAEEGMLNFGDRHALNYTQRLMEMFDRLAAMPYIAAERPAANGMVRLMPCGSHNSVAVGGVGVGR